MFSGVRAVLLLTPSQATIVTKNLQTHGGVVVSGKDGGPPPTHVVLDQPVSSALPMSLICKKMGVNEEEFDKQGPPLVVALQWINKSIGAKGAHPVALAPFTFGMLTSGQVAAVAQQEEFRRQEELLKKEQEAQAFKKQRRESGRVAYIPDADYEQKPLVGQWVVRAGLYMYKLHPDNNINSKVVAAFDMDDTIIESKSGKLSNGEHNWQIISPSVKEKLHELHNQGAYLVLISNQKLLGQPPHGVTFVAFQDKINALMSELDVPFDFMCAVGVSVYRKPCMGMWQFLTTHRCPEYDPELSFFVGDAAGRPATSGRKKDFADSDYKFAINSGVRFHTPEAFFYNSTDPLHVLLPSPERRDDKKIFMLASTRDVEGAALAQDEDALSAALTPHGLGPEILLLVAPAACGKSSLAKRFCREGYERVNQDTLGSIQKCHAATREIISRQRSVVVDNTNLMFETRQDWVQLALSLMVPIRCVVLSTPKPVAMALNMFRAIDPCSPPEDRLANRLIPDVAINTHFKAFNSDQVSDAEGFARIDRLNWIPQEPEHPGSKILWHSYIL
jgi:bifunctional polynucleotide phosphatase/kinase